MNIRNWLALPVAAMGLWATGCNEVTSPNNESGDMAMAQPNADYGPEPLDGGPNVSATTAVVGTSSFMTSGTLTTIDFATKAVPSAPIDTTLDQDNMVRSYGGKVYVLDRTHGSLRIYDPAAGWKSPVEIETGDATAPNSTSNPHDVFPIPSSSKVYVAMFGNDADHALGVVDTATPGDGVVKWIPLPKAGSNLVRANNLYFCGPYVYVVLEDLDSQFAVTGNGRIAIVDPRTDALDTEMPNVIPLMGKNPGGGAPDAVAPLDPIRGSCDIVLVSDTGDFTKQVPNTGGGVEKVDLTRRKSSGFVVTDGDLMGTPGTVSTASDTLAFAIVNNADFTNSVIAFDPTGKKVLGKVLGPAGFISFASVAPNGQLYAGVARSDSKAGQPATGVYVGTASSSALSGTPIDLKQAPYAISFY